MKTVFFRLLEAEDKASALLAALSGPAQDTACRFEIDPQSFLCLPRAPFVYWVSERIRRAFGEFPPFTSAGRTARQGLATGDDFRFVRAWWAVTPASVRQRWYVFAKGGVFSPYYADIAVVVGYSRGDQVGLMAVGRYGRGADRYFTAGLTWPARPYRRGSFSLVSPGAIFSHTGTMVFTKSRADLFALACVLNSDAFIGLLHTLMPRGGEGSDRTLKYEVGYVTSVPVPDCDASVTERFDVVFTRAWSLSRSLDTRTETSHAFTLPALLQSEATTLSEGAAAWAGRVASAKIELATIQTEINARCFDLYRIEEADRRAITDGFVASSTSSSDDAQASADPEETEPEEVDEAHDDDATLTAELLSWSIATAFGRFDVRLATGARPLPPEPDPFDPLPVCSPGMLTGADGLPVAAPPPGYLLSFPADGLLVDDPGHARDLTTATRAVFDTVFPTDAHDRWSEAAALLDPKDRDLRTWIARSYFDLHLKRYSKSRRKAPILWQLATSSSRYAVWIYAHRTTKDTFFQVQNDLVTPKLHHEERKLNDLRETAGPSPTAGQRKEIAEQEGIVEEVRTMLEEIKRVAPLWRPDLDDGVILTMAPLHRLVPQHKAWQKELKAAWEALAAGKYDWAHLAMHLWPERVVPKCAEDRSLAIAHGLEEVFWVEGDDGKWKARARPTTPVAELVAARSSPAVRDALRALQEAPTPAGPAGRQGRGKRK